MGTLFLILGALFLALIIIVPLLERFGKHYSQEEVGKISRYVIPLMILLFIAQGVRYLFF